MHFLISKKFTNHFLKMGYFSDRQSLLPQVLSLSPIPKCVIFPDLVPNQVEYTPASFSCALTMSNDSSHLFSAYCVPELTLGD